MGCEYSIVTYVRQITDISTSDLSDAKLMDLANYAWNDIMLRIGKRETLEEVQYIDQYRQNRVDGSNATFYTKNSFKRYSGDLNNDMELTTDDIEVWLYTPSTNSRSQATVSTYSASGQFVLSEAPPNGTKLYATYLHLPLSIDTLDPLIRDAVAFQTASFAYGKLDPQDYESISFRGLSIRRSGPFKMNGAFDTWSARSNEKVTFINNLQTFIRTEDLEREYALQINYNVYKEVPNTRY